MSASQGQEPLVGSLLSAKYQVHRQIGHGGMGDVYEGTHVLMERRVAIKVMHARWSANDPSCLLRFRLEAKATSCLNHPNIMTVFDFGITDNGIGYLVMDYIDGQGLDELLMSQRRLELSRVLEIFMQCCDALAHAHDKGVVHRDLKPSNIMLTPDHLGKEQVKIVDFGIAKLLPGRAHSLKSSPRDSQVVGSPLYMSPEQCKGNSNIDGRSDIYSLGCLMYHALTGRPPVNEETVLGIIYAHINQAPLPLGIVAPDLGLPPRVEAVIFKALSKNPDERQQSMRELKEELELCLDQPAQPQPVRNAVADMHTPTDLKKFPGPGQDLVPHLQNLADFYIASGKTKRAEGYLCAAIRALVDAHGAWDLSVGEAVKKLADYYRDAGRYADAEPLYSDLLAIKCNALGNKHPDIPCLLLRIAEVNFHLADYEKSQRYYSRCLRLCERMYGANDPALVPILTGLASASRRLQQYQDAARSYLRALSLKELHLGPDHYDLAATLVGLGVVYRFEERFAETDAALQRALSIYEKTVGEAHQHSASVILLLAESMSAQQRNEEAEQLYARAVRIREAVSSSTLEVAEAYDVWAAHYLSKQELAPAEAAYRKALSLKEIVLGDNHPEMASALSLLAALYEAQNNYSAAEEYYKRAVKCAGSKISSTKLSEP